MRAEAAHAIRPLARGRAASCAMHAGACGFDEGMTAEAARARTAFAGRPSAVGAVHSHNRGLDEGMAAIIARASASPAGGRSATRAICSRKRFRGSFRRRRNRGPRRCARCSGVPDRFQDPIRHMGYSAARRHRKSVSQHRRMRQQVGFGQFVQDRKDDHVSGRLAREKAAQLVAGPGFCQEAGAYHHGRISGARNSVVYGPSQAASERQGHPVEPYLQAAARELACERTHKAIPVFAGMAYENVPLLRHALEGFRIPVGREYSESLIEGWRS